MGAAHSQEAPGHELPCLYQEALQSFCRAGFTQTLWVYGPAVSCPLLDGLQVRSIAELVDIDLVRHLLLNNCAPQHVKDWLQCVILSLCEGIFTDLKVIWLYGRILPLGAYQALLATEPMKASSLVKERRLVMPCFGADGQPCQVWLGVAGSFGPKGAAFFHDLGAEIYGFLVRHADAVHEGRVAPTDYSVYQNWLAGSSMQKKRFIRGGGHMLKERSKGLCF